MRSASWSAGWPPGRVAAIVGLPPDTTEDALKALGAGAASSGSVAMFHAVGLTPEAPTLEAAVGPDREPDRVRVDVATLQAALASLATVAGRPDRRGRPRDARTSRSRSSGGSGAFLAETPGPLRVELTVNTSRGVLAEITERGWLDELASGRRDRS